ncbi:MAG TPA: DNA polymerase III subunit alpha [Patescibacteria group bacterium]|nr:DNA polymerase III subunit alpha [Patescibacteria group bacterium]
MSFVHLHCHTHYSLLDGLSKPQELLEQAKKLGMPALAITDHGNLYGAIEFYTTGLEVGVKPIIGVEAYIAPRTMVDKEGKIDSDYYHLTLLCENYEGYLNLLKLVTLANTEGFYYKPRLDLSVLATHSKGLIALSGCMRGQVARGAMQSPVQGQKELDKYVKIFGKDNFFIEIQRNATDTKSAMHETELNKRLVELARVNNLPLAATADCHYISPDDKEAQDVLVCIGTQKTITDPNRLDMSGHDLYLKSPEEMRAAFFDLPEAIESTLRIAERVTLEIPINQRYFPTVEVPEGKTQESYLTEIVYEKAKKFFPEGLSEEVKKRIDYELEIINAKGFAPYFLMVADIVYGAKFIGAITNTRGSAAGSLVGRILEITNVDPLEFELPFERFLTMHRPTPPDIDLDISDNRRDEVIAWITERYGKDKVAQILTFGTMQARAVIRDVGRALGVSYAKCDRLAKMIPIGKQGFNMTLDKALDISPEFKEAVQRDPESGRIFSIAKKLEGGVRHASIHAAGIVITPTPLTDYMSLQKEPGGDRLITQYDMYALDAGASSKAIGVVKMDLLGIRNLTILEQAVKLVKLRHGIEINIYKLPHPDPKTFKLLSDGLTFGVFQLGSAGMTRYLKELKPSSIFDVMAMIALYRPGPLQFIPDFISRKHNSRLITYLDPALEKILTRTYGVLVYQDDLLSIAHDLAGYSWPEVDMFRKAVGKKIPEEMLKQKEKFIKGTMKTAGWSTEKAEQIWTWIEPFAAYGFNKSHSASYSVVAYQTAYMKANYPVEFMAAVMTAESGNEDKISAAVEECKIMGIQVLPPDVNESNDDFTVVDKKTIRFGLTAIKNLGGDVIDSIKTARAKDGPFKELQDFVMRCYVKNFNKKSWEALVMSGALDNFGERGMLMANTEIVLEFLRDLFRVDDAGQGSLFGSKKDFAKLRLKPAEPATMDEKLNWEKQLLGLYVSGHPLMRFEKVLSHYSSVRSVMDSGREAVYTVGGIVIRLRRTVTKKQQPMAMFWLQDMTGSIECLVFPKTMEKVMEHLQDDAPVEVTGKLSFREDQATFLVEDMKPLVDDELYSMALSEVSRGKDLVLYFKNNVSYETMLQVADILKAHPGPMQVYVKIDTDPDKRIRTQSKVGLNESLKEELMGIREISKISHE